MAADTLKITRAEIGDLGEEGVRLRIAAWAQGRVFQSWVDTASGDATFTTDEAVPEPAEGTDSDASPDVVAALGECAVLLSDALGRGVAPLVAMVESARDTAVRLEGENDRLLRALRAVLGLSVVRDGLTWSQDQSVAQEAHDLLADLEP